MKPLLKNAALLLFSVGISTQLFSQQISAPEIEWKKIDWAFSEPDSPIITSPNPGAGQSQDESASEWWYDIARSLDESGRNDGFYASGFATWHNLSINEPSEDGCYNQLPETGPDCQFPRLSGQPVSPNIATVGKYDHSGRMIWCKPACVAAEGAYSVTTTDDGSVYFTGFGTVSRDVLGNIIKLNPRTSDPDGDDIKELGVCSENTNKAIVGKFDREGNLLWVNQYMPGDINGNSANDIDLVNNDSRGWAITENPNTNTVKVAASHVGNDGFLKLFVFDVDDQGLLIPGSRKVHGDGTAHFSVRYITPEGNGDYLISGYREPGSFSSGTDAILLRIDGSNNSLKPISTYAWGSTTALIRYNASGSNNVGQDVVIANNGNIVWSLIEDCNICTYAANNIGKGKLLIYDEPNNNFYFKDLQDESNLGFQNVNAFDMKIGLTATADGNIALITTIKEGDVDITSGLFPDIISDLSDQVGIDCSSSLDPGYWNTNAYIAKYSAVGNLIWEKTFDSHDDIPVNHPGDYKKQECVYDIVEGDDGGLVFVGNTSHNQDDYYIVRLESDCQEQNQFAFDVQGGEYINFPNTQIVIDDLYFAQFPQNFPVNPVVFEGDLVIASGSDVVIDGITIEFAEDSKVIVEPGARLRLRNGAKLTSHSFCPSSMWQGVEVWGDNTLRQSPNNQGFLTMSNSTIENAVIGVAMVKRDGSDYDLDYTGGILQASNADFKNNVIAVDFHPYDNFYVNSSGATVPLNNISRINNCSFEVDHINDPEYAYVFDPNNNDPNNELRSHICFVKLEGVRGLNIRGNDFVNNEPNAIGERRGKGILAWESDFDVREYCPILAPNGNCTSTPTPNLFENLYYGVHVKQMGASDGIRIANSTFNSNKFGIYFEGASNFAEIYSNTFNIDEDMTGTFANANGGIKLDNASGFKVEDNTFNSNSQTTGGNAGGILVENSSFLTSSEMYRNTFNDLDVSVQTAGNNNDLSVDCNTFNHFTGSIDWHNTEVNSSSPGLISDQGACVPDPEAPQANEFIGTYDPMFSRQILNNPGNPSFDYSSYSDPSFLPNSALVDNANVIDCSQGIGSYDDVCPSKLPTQGGIFILRDNLISVGGVIGGISGTIDAGDKAALINIIQTEPAHIVRNTLMDVSPYLSDDVLIALIQEPNTPDWAVDQVLSANAPLTTSVIKALIIDPKAYPDNLLRDQINASSPLADESLLVTLMERNPTVSDWVIKDVMLNNTPLRDPSLLAFLTKSAPSANYVVRDVLKVNTPLSDAVDAQFIANGYPNWVVNAVYSSTVVAGDPDNKVSPKSERQAIESQLNYYGKQETQIESAIVRHYILEDSTEQAIAFLEERGSVRASCALLPFYYRKRDGGKLGQHVGIVEQFANDRLAEDPDSRIGKEAQALCKFYETVYAIKTQPGGYTAITGAQVAIMEDYAARNIALAENFENVLEYIGKKEEDPALWYPVMVNGVEKTMEISESEEVEAAPIAEDPTVKIYPNPTNGFVTISYTIPNASGTIYVSIYNLMGQEMRTFEAQEANGAERFSTRDFNNGVYIVTIRDEKGIQHTGKLVVQH